MDYNNQDIVDAVDEHGEIILVFESGQEYEVHPHTLEESGDELVLSGDYEGESRNVYFTGDIVEYYYTHDEL